MRIRKKIIILVIAILMITSYLSGCTETSNNSNKQSDEINNNDNSNNSTNYDNSTEEEEERIKENELSPHLIGYWKFDETSGTSVEDIVNNYNGTLHGNPTFTTGKKGNALYFDGIDDYVQLPQSAIDQIGSLNNGTISFWFNFTSILDTQTIMPLFYIGNEDINDDDSLFVIEIGHFNTENQETGFFDPDNKKLYSTWVDLSQEQDPFLCFDTNFSLEENTWYHFAIMVNQTGNTAYLDGQELTHRYYNFGDKNDNNFLTSIPVKEILTIGYGKSHHEVTSDFVYYKGYIDDLKIFNTTLSSSELQDIQ